MRLLFIGDVVGESGCEFLQKKLYTIKKEHKIDITVVNGENSAPGNGVTKNSLDFLVNAGADVVTTGNHAFSRRENVDVFEKNDFLLRPANFPKGVVGKGYVIYEVNMMKIAIINLMGTVFLQPLDNPFLVIEEILEELKAENVKNIFVDFHAEASAEKKAMGHFLAGKVTAVLGTHTHVQTSDSIILKDHTAYITDVGMTGPELSVLGVKSEIVIEKFKTCFPYKFETSENPPFLNGVVVDFNENLGKSNSLFPVIYR